MKELIIFDNKKRIITDTTYISHYEEIFDYHIFSHIRFDIGIVDIIDLTSNKSFLEILDEGGTNNYKSVSKTKIYGAYSSPTSDDIYISDINNQPTIRVAEFSPNADRFIKMSGNYCYTLHFNVKSIISKEYLVIYKINEYNNTDNSRIIKIHFKSVHTDKKDIYDDLLVNYDLPKYDELEKAIVNEDKAHLIKRLLLDYKNIMQSKGTDESIRKFMYFIGFDPDAIKIYPEYLKEVYDISTNNVIDYQKTIEPNKYTDIKTGYYHVLYDNYRVYDNDEITNLNEHLTNKNLPKRIINNTNIDEFFTRLFYGITLANKYFTVPEQDISFFGMNNSSNFGRFQSIAGNTTVTHIDDIHHFKNNIDISLSVKEREKEHTYIVRNNKSINSSIYKTELKAVINSNSLVKKNLYIIDKEISDDLSKEEINQLLPFSYIKTFGNILHLEIKNTHKKFGLYVTYTIKELYSTEQQIVQERFRLEPNTSHKIMYLTKKSSDYQLIVDIRDDWNNRELYTYDYLLDDSVNRLDFDVFNTKSVDISWKNKYESENIGIFTDVDSAWNTTRNINFNRVLDLFDVNNLQNLKEYFVYHKTLDGWKIHRNERYFLPEISKNTIIDNVTETLPIGFLDTHIEIGTLPLLNYSNHKILLLDKVSSFMKFYEIGIDANNTITNNDGLFFQIVEVIENQDTPDIKTKHIFITTNSVGLNLNPLYKIYLVEDSLYQELRDNSFDNTFDGSFTTELSVDIKDTRFKLLYDLPDYIQTEIPINYDVPTLFHNSIDTLQKYNINLPENNRSVESLYPRMVNIKDYDGYYINIGDVILARVNHNYISEFENIKWQVVNSFTKKVLHETDDYLLKYRVSHKTIFDIILTFDIYGKQYKLEKKSIQSSISN